MLSTIAVAYFLVATLVGIYGAYKFGGWDLVKRVARGEQVYISGPLFGMMTPKLPRFLRAERGQLGLQTVLAALVVVIAVSLAVIVVDRFDSSLGDPSSSSLSTAQNDVLSGFSDMTSLIGPLLLVAIAVVIIGLIRQVS